jgi:hypothetical protein
VCAGSLARTSVIVKIFGEPEAAQTLTPGLGRRYPEFDEVVVVTGYSYADVVERLFREFEDRFSLTVIVEVVHECRAQLTCVPESAMSEMLERLARQRLSSTPQPTPSASPDETIARVDHGPDADWIRTGPDAQGAGAVSADVAAGR